MAKSKKQPTEPKITIAEVTDLIPDENNANAGTERGHYMIKESVSTLGTGRGVLVDKNNRLIAGNKTVEAAVISGIETVIIVETTGNELVVHKRVDLDLTKRNGQARKMAYADNRASEVSYKLDPVVMAGDLESGLDLSAYWHDNELKDILEQAGTELDKIALSDDDEPLFKPRLCPHCGGEI